VRGFTLKTIWAIEKEDRQKKISYQVCKMEINDHGKNIVLEEQHILRLWIFEDLKSLIRKSGKFELAAIYDESHKQRRCLHLASILCIISRGYYDKTTFEKYIYINGSGY
jgi:hypothetical protein